MNPWLPGYSLEEWEKVAILGAMKFCDQNKTRAAAMLKCSVRTVDAKLEKYAIEDEHARQQDEERRHQARIDLQRARGIDPQASSEGIRLQSPTQISTQQPVPLREASQVQEMLSAKAAPSGQRRRR